MRMLLTLGAIVTAMLMPWNSLAPSWLPDASGSAIEPAGDSGATRPAGPVARLNPAWGIAPVSADEAEQWPVPFGENGDLGSGGGHSASSESPPGLHCENGVCTLPDGTNIAGSPLLRSRAGAAAGVHDLRERLLNLGATQFRLDRDAAGDGFRCSCSVPFGSNSRLNRRFEATAESEFEAVQIMLAQVEQWRRERSE